MLKADGEIKFTLVNREYKGGKHFRPVFSFGDDLLFSGTIVSEIEDFLYNQVYRVFVEFFTIEDEAYAFLKPMLKNNMDLTIREGSRIVGIAKLSNFEYSD